MVTIPSASEGRRLLRAVNEIANHDDETGVVIDADAPGNAFDGDGG